MVNKPMTKPNQSNLAQKSGKTAATPLTPKQIKPLIAPLNGWKATTKQISKNYKFKDFHETMAFVNVIAWISHRENHHPDLQVGYNTCTVTYSTHSIGGLSQNDFTCATQ